MSERHVTAAELELYVLGALDAVRVDSFEAHCAACDVCAAGLSGEASLELAFEQVARRAARGPVVKPLRAMAYAAAGVVAMAAGALLWFGRSPVATVGAGEATSAARHAAMNDGAILDARNDALDGG